MMKGWAFSLAMAAANVGASAHACAEYSFSPLFAEARVRSESGGWRPTFIEAAGKSIRIEQQHPRTPWGRLVVTGRIDHGGALVYPIGAGSPVPEDARVTWKTSLSDALPELGLGDKLLEAPWASVTGGQLAARSSTFRGYPCVFDTTGASGELVDRSVCVHSSGLPLFIKGQTEG